MSSAAHLVEEALCAGLLLSRRGEHVHIDSPLGHPLPEALRERLVAHRDELLAYLDYCARADVFLLATSRRIWERCPAGFPLAGESWRAAEERLVAAHETQDLVHFCRALLVYEHFANAQFAAYEMEGRP